MRPQGLSQTYMKKIITVAVIALIVGLVLGYAVHPANAPGVKGVSTTGNSSNYTNISSNTLQIGTNCDLSYLLCPAYRGFSVDSNGIVISSTTMQRGGMYATTTGANASSTLSSTDFGSSTISININLASGFTLTLPATSTIASLIPTPGDTLEITIINATTTSLQYLTVVGGTGSILQATASTSRIYPGMAGNLTAVRKSNSDILWLLGDN